MLYFKNVDLAKRYRISEGTVRNWINAAEAGKLDLSLYKDGDKVHVANTPSNMLLVEHLVGKRRKYRNTKALKSVSPSAKFYQIYNQAQIYDIVTSLEVHKEIPRQYNYFGDGAYRWRDYLERLDQDTTVNILNTTRKLLAKNQSYIDDLMAQYERINLVDIGVGNAYAVRDLMAHLLNHNKLNRYVAIDISQDMLQIAKQNIGKWYGNRVLFEGYELDITRDRFENILAQDYIKNTSKHTGNLILFLGATLQNFRKPDIPLQIINNSMGANDYLIHTGKLDTEKSRQYFDFNLEPGNTALSPHHSYILDLLNIEELFYEAEMGYDISVHQRYVRVRLKVALDITFKFNGGVRTIGLDKGETVLLLRVWQDTALDVIHNFVRNDFHILQSSQTEDEEYILTVSRIKRNTL